MDKQFDILLEAVCNDPEDWDLRLIFADYCEEQGLISEMECLKWMSRNKKRSYCKCWFNPLLRFFRNRPIERDTHSHIPTELYEYLDEFTWFEKHSNPQSQLEYYVFKEYKTRQEAELALYRAWKKAKEYGEVIDEQL